MEKDANEKLLLAERVNNLFNQPLLFILFCQTAMIFLTAWYLSGTESLRLILTWFILSIVVTAGMITLVIFYRKSDTRRHHSQFWLKTFFIAIITNGLIWSAPALFPHTFDSSNSVQFFGIMLLGVVAAALPIMSTFSKFFTVFSLFTLLPITVRFFYSDEILYNIFGFMFLVYLSVQLLSSRNIQNVLVKSLRLGFENSILVDNLKIKNQQAEEAKVDAELANEAKSKFLAAASHDLRQPMHALGLFVSKIYNQQRYPDIHNDVGNIKKSSDALESLLNALLDISKLDAGVLQPELTSISLEAILNRVTTNGESKAKEKGLKFRVHNINKTVHSDIFMLERILNNLVSNAIRYTTSGSVFIGCRLRANKVRIEVRDSGIGIEKNKFGDIFEEFYQAGNPERDRSKGLGLGLAIVDRLCNLLDYKIEVQSSPGKGSLFAIEVPYVDTSDIPSTVLTSNNLFVSDVSGLHVLVIDDEAMIREGMAATLEDWDCSSLLADSADTAISHLQQSDFKPDVIVTDYRLRENQTGVQAIERINEYCQKDIPAIIITGDTAPDRLQEAKDSSYLLLHKPVSPAKLRSLLSYMREQIE